MRPLRFRPAPQDPDLQPMIDVVFLLLIFFLCTLHFRVLEGRLDTELPRDRGQTATAEVREVLEPLELSVRATPDGARVRVGRGPEHPLQGLRTALAPLLIALTRAGTPPTDVRVRSGEGVTYGDVVPVLDTCLALGLPRLSFALPDR